MQDMDDWPKLPEEFTKAPPAAAEGGEREEGPDLAREIKQAGENKDRFTPDKGEMQLLVPPHDFRLIEVSWEE